LTCTLIRPLGLALALVGSTLATSASAQNTGLLDWAEHKRQELRLAPKSVDRQFNEPDLLARASRAKVRFDPRHAAELAGATRSYAAQFGDNSLSSFVWTGVESGNPLTRAEDYRWDSIEDQGLFDPVRRQGVISELQRAGIANVRLGLSNHRIDLDDPASWREHDALIHDFAAAGLRISLDLHHFGIEDRFRATDAKGSPDPARSYYLNPDWPDYFARFARQAYARYADEIAAVTLINEPETVVGFNSEMWHGAFPGWSHPLHNFYYIERAIQVAKASVLARREIQNIASGRSLLFVHPEAVVYKPYWGDFNRFVRFLPSDLILGADWLIDADLQRLASRSADEIAGAWRRKPARTRTSLDWLVENYVVYNQPQDAWKSNQARLVTLLSELRELHLQLAREHHVTMRTNTVFGIDYYAHNEDKDRQGRKLSPEPQAFAGQVRSGRRSGLLPLLVDYFNRYQMPVMIAESGTPYFHYGARWHQEMLLEVARAMAAGTPVVGYAFYPTIDTWGWEAALSIPKAQTLLNPGGLLSQSLVMRPFLSRVLNSLGKWMPGDDLEASLLGKKPSKLPGG
jgi:hypothetical protein